MRINFKIRQTHLQGYKIAGLVNLDKTKSYHIDKIRIAHTKGYKYIRLYLQDQDGVKMTIPMEYSAKFYNDYNADKNNFWFNNHQGVKK